MTGYTIVTREAEWDDREREKLDALAAYESGVCSCGFHQSQMVPGVHFYKTEVTKCPVCAAGEMSQRLVVAQEEADREVLRKKMRVEQLPPGQADPADGRKIYIRPKADQ